MYKTNQKLNIFSKVIKFTYIETRLFWEDGLTAGELAKSFDITRQTAQTVIDEYRETHPHQMKYDRRKKRHVATDNFKPEYISPDPITFLDYLRGQRLREHYLEEKGGWSDIEVKDVDRLLRPRLSREIIQAILGALRHQQTLLIEYHAVMPDDIQVRIISPNYLVFADNRYHLHAYCHTRQKYLDFVLTRILSADPSKEEWVSGEHSHEWKEPVTLRFRPNPELPELVRKTLLRGYPGNEREILEISCNKNEAFYLRRKLLKECNDKKVQLWIEITE